NNLEDIPTDELISNVTPIQSLIDEAILLAFVICGIPFRIVNNSFFTSALKLLNLGYNIPSCEVLSGCLLDSEFAKVIHKVDGILEHTNNLTISLDGFFTDLQYLSDVLFPIKEAILAVEANCSTLANCYINLVKIAVAIQNLSIDEYKGFHNEYVKKFNKWFEEFNDPIYQLTYFLHPAYKGLGLKFALGWIYGKHRTRLNIDQLEGLAKIYQFNLSNPIEQLHHTQTAEITSEIMTNIAETVFKEFEEETLIEDDDIEMLNPAENLYPNE
ncbi:20845_t:CDS:2, partial [Cetraspora pellucida]